MVGSDEFPFGARPIFMGKLSVSFREGTPSSRSPHLQLTQFHSRFVDTDIPRYIVFFRGPEFVAKRVVFFFWFMMMLDYGSNLCPERDTFFGLFFWDIMIATNIIDVHWYVSTWCSDWSILKFLGKVAALGGESPPTSDHQDGPKQRPLKPSQNHPKPLMSPGFLKA